MKLNKDYKMLQRKLRRGVSLNERDFNKAVVLGWPKNSQVIYNSAQKGGMLEGLGDFSDDLVNQLVAGTWAPDELLGVSVKTLLAGLIVLMVVRSKRAVA